MQSANFARREFRLESWSRRLFPGLTDHEVPKILEACAKAGAQFAGYTIVRLPWAVAPLFEHWLEEHFPGRKEKVLGRIRHLRGDRLNNSHWHTRMTGEGILPNRSLRFSKLVVVVVAEDRGTSQAFDWRIQANAGATDLPLVSSVREQVFSKMTSLLL